MSAAGAFAIGAVLHAGFQLTVTVLVYPALVEVADEQWRLAHARHSRRITPLVGLVYLVLLATGTAYVADSPGPVGWAAIVATALALAVTAALAAPLHGRLGTDDAPVPMLRRRLLVIDRVRCAAAVVGAAAAIAAAAAA